MDTAWLNIVWFVLFVIIIAGYLIMDGFDLGVGILHPFLAKNDQERRVSLNSIGPVWDGNEVWLVLGGGALFAAFPLVYASLFSGFYTAMMLVLLVLILRTVAIEFRSKRPSARWRTTWDIVFFASSLGIALLLGVAFGNIMQGVPLDAQGNIRISLISLLNPFALLVGVTTVFMLATHGAIYLSMKTEGEHLVRIKRWIPRLMIIFFVLNTAVVAVTVFTHDLIAERYLAQPLWVIFPALALASVILARLDGGPGALLYRVPAFVRHDRRPALLGRDRPVSLPADLDAGPCLQPDDLQCCFGGQHADGHADHCRDRHAVCAAVHGRRVLHFPRPGAVGSI